MHPYFVGHDQCMRNLLFFVLLLSGAALQAQTYVPGQTYFSANGHIEYRCGDLPLVISVPHGGALDPADIPDRTCNNPVYDVDANTVELGEAIDSVFAAQEGCRPHMVINHLARRKLDANRNLADGACGDPQAVLAWQAFHAFIDSAKALVAATAGKGFYLDLHGHGHTVQRLELGYLLYADELVLSDATLNTSTYIDYSSIRALALQNQLALTHAELLRGPLALGTRLASQGYPSVPSQQDPFPQQGQPYFSGGYNTARQLQRWGDRRRTDRMQFQRSARQPDEPRAFRRLVTGGAHGLSHRSLFRAANELHGGRCTNWGRGHGHPVAESDKRIRKRGGARNCGRGTCAYR